MLFRSLLVFLLVTAVFAADARRFLEEAASEGAVACPTPGSPTIVLTQLDSGGSIPLLPTAGPGRLCTLTLREALNDGTFGSPVPVARSHDGRPWEVTAGPFSGVDPIRGHAKIVGPSNVPTVDEAPGTVTVPDPAVLALGVGWRAVVLLLKGTMVRPRECSLTPPKPRPSMR